MDLSKQTGRFVKTPKQTGRFFKRPKQTDFICEHSKTLSRGRRRWLDIDDDLCPKRSDRV